MATGKTAVGKALAKKLGMKYVSTDDLVEKRSGMKISKIFERFGEKHFRNLETQALQSIKRKKNIILSCGGGIVIKPRNLKLLKSLGTVIWLKADPETVDSRLGDIKKRPLLNIADKGGRIAAIRKMLRSRSKYYKNASNTSINTSGFNIPKIVHKIISLIS